METYGTFTPFGAGLFENGNVQYVWYAKPGETVESPGNAIPLIRTALSSQANSGRLLSSAVIYLYKNSNGEEQINVELEYISGFAKVVATKFSIDNNTLSFGSAGSNSMEARVFTKQPK